MVTTKASKVSKPSTPHEQGVANDVQVFETFKLMVEMADRVSQRRQAANSFYLTLNTLIFGASAYIRTSETPFHVSVAISLAGILASLLWTSSISSYKTLNQAKFDVIQDIEKRLHYQPYAEEWKKLDPDRDGIRHKPFHVTELLVPKVFIALYSAQILFTIPWSSALIFAASFFARCGAAN